MKEIKNTAAKPAEKTSSAKADKIKQSFIREIKDGKIFQGRKFKYGSVATALTCVVIVLVVLINLFTQFMTDRFNLKLDISGIGLYDFDDATYDILTTMDQNVTIYVASSESNYQDGISIDQYLGTNSMEVHEILNRFVNGSNGHITVKYIDTIKNPLFFSKFDIDPSTLNGTLVVVGEDNTYKCVSYYDLYEYDSSTYAAITSLAEQKLVYAIEYVMGVDMPKLAFITGHEENMDTYLEYTYKNNNCEICEVNITNEELTDDIDVIVIASPVYDYTSEDIAKLDAFMRSGKNAIVLAGAEMPELPNFEAYLEEWGVGIDSTLVLDTDKAMSNAQEILLNANTEIYGSLALYSDMYIASQNTRKIDILWNVQSGRYVYPLVYSSDSSYCKTTDEDSLNEVLAKEDADTDGPFTVASITVAEFTTNNKIVRSNMIVYGSTELASQTYMVNAKYLNSRMFTANLSLMFPEDEAVSVTGKTYNDFSMSVTTAQSDAMLWALGIITPLIILVVGIAIWFRRRNA